MVNFGDKTNAACIGVRSKQEKKCFDIMWSVSKMLEAIYLSGDYAKPKFLFQDLA